MSRVKTEAKQFNINDYFSSATKEVQEQIDDWHDRNMLNDMQNRGVLTRWVEGHVENAYRNSLFTFLDVNRREEVLHLDNCLLAPKYLKDMVEVQFKKAEKELIIKQMASDN
jgi:hypothetical protein